MASTKVVQRSFTGGEICPDMFGRFDDLKYANGLEKAENFIVLPQGPIENRAGFAHVAEVKDSTKRVRLIPFAYNVDQTMIIELGDKYARFHTAGKPLMNAEGTAPYEIVTPWAEADLFEIGYVQSADVMTLVHRAYPPQEIRRYSYQDWRIAKCDFDVKLSKPSNAKAVRETEAASDQNAEKYKFKYAVSALSADKLTESEPAYTDEVTANLYAYGTTVKISWSAVSGAAFYRVYKCQGGLYGLIGDTEELSIIDDDIDPDMSITPRRYDDVFNSMRGIVSVQVTDGGSGYARSFKDMLISGNTFQGSEEERTLNGVTFTSMYQRDDTWLYREGTYTGGTVTGYYASVRGNHTVNNFFFNSGGWSDGRIAYSDKHATLTGKIRMSINEAHPSMDDVSSADIELIVEDSTGTGAVLRPVVTNGVITAVNVVQGGRNYTNPTIRVVSEKGSGAKFKITVGTGGDYPAAVGYFEQRRCFAGMANDPQRIVMTRSGTEDDFSYSLPTRDDDRISQQIAVNEFNDIRHLVSLSQLLLMTAGAEVRISPMNSDALTPSSFSARPQSYLGCSTVRPVMVNNNVIYAAARGGHVREFAYQDAAGGYVSGDLCLRSSHLFDFKTIVDMALMKAPTPIVWCVSSDGSLLGLTYIPEQQVGAWHRHTTAGSFESIATVSEGDQDYLYAVVQRTINGEAKRFVERLSTRQFYNVKDAFFVDCGGTYRGDPATEISGLDWLEGETVAILADGAVQPPQDVTGGKITLAQPASVVHVGLPYSSEAKTLPVVLETVQGAGMGITKNVYKAHLRVYNASGVEVGPTFDELTEYKQRTTESPGTPPALKTGEIEVAIRPAWDQDGVICIRQEDPLPLKVLSLALELGV